MAENRAAWIQSAKSHPFVVSSAPMPPAPPPSFVTIQVHAVAINPADAGIQSHGVLVDKYPAILGCDAAGIITAVGSEVKDYEVGDRVLGLADHLNETAGQGTFALYCNLRSDLIAKVPETVEFKDACVLPCALTTAAFSLFEEEGLGLGFPGEGKGKGEVVLIWGGSSSVGSCGIQMAKAAGYAVAVTAGAHNLEYCKGIGADYAFDYRKESVVEDVVGALKGKSFAGAFNTTLYPETYTTCAEIVQQLGGVQKVASVFPGTMPTNRDLPHGVKFGNCNCYEIRHSGVGPEILGRYIPRALADGSLICKPDAVVVGHGLEYCQEAVDRVRAGASAQKFVVTLV